MMRKSISLILYPNKHLHAILTTYVHFQPWVCGRKMHELVNDCSTNPALTMTPAGIVKDTAMNNYNQGAREKLTPKEGILSEERRDGTERSLISQITQLTVQRARNRAIRCATHAL